MKTIAQCKDKACGYGLSICCLECEDYPACPESCSGASWDCEWSDISSTERRAEFRAYKQTKLLVAIILLIAMIGMLMVLVVADAVVDVAEEPNFVPFEFVAFEREVAPTLVSLGEYKITHYDPSPASCGIWADGITATGTTATAGRTIATDPNVIPMGTVVVIDGQEYIAEDVGGAIKGQRIDIFVDTYDEAISRGVIYREVFVYGEEQ